MFGGQDENGSAPRDAGAPQDGTLNGVNDIAGGTPVADPVPDSGYAPAPPEPVVADTPAPQAETEISPAPAPADDTTVAPVDPAVNDDLLELKQQALQKLTPIVGHLEQTAEEKFRTTMMLIQASDNQSLLKDAYEAANAIEDEKTKAQALLDVINEINYFTQSSK